MKKLFILVFTVILAILLMSCRKTNPYYPISPTLLQYCYFKEGSHWIYKNENGGFLDSCHIKIPPLFSTSTFDQENEYYYDFVDMNFRSNFLDWGHLQSTPDFDFGVITSHKCSFIGSIRTDAIVGRKILWGPSIIYQTLELFDEYKLNNVIFKNVIHTKIVQPYDYDSVVCHYYFCKNIGLIKYQQHVFNTDSTWSLLRWYVVQ